MISILIPVYNVKEFIKRCLKSVAVQTSNQHIECIIVDDCGHDGSIEIAEDFIRSYKGPIRFKIIHHKKNRGLAAARNTGIKSCNGEYVIHLDSDDWLEPNAIELLSQKQQETNADIVSGKALAHFNNNVKELSEPDYANNMEMVHNTIKMTLDHVIWRRLIRKDLYTDNGIWAEEGVNIGEDHHTLPRLAFFAKNIAKIDEIVYNYNCMNPNSYMQRTRNRISITRYQNDIRSLLILKEFFVEKDKSIVSELNSITEQYKLKSRNDAISLADKDGYFYLCQDQGIIPQYSRMRIIYFLKKIIKNIIRR